MSEQPSCRELVEKHDVEDMALVVLIPQDTVVNGGKAQVFSPRGRVTPNEAASLLHTLAWSLEGGAS